MINLLHLDDCELSTLVMDKCKLKPSDVFFSAVDIALLFSRFKSFRFRDVKYEFLEYYPEHTLKRAVKALSDSGLVERDEQSYSFPTFIH